MGGHHGGGEHKRRLPRQLRQSSVTTVTQILNGRVPHLWAVSTEAAKTSVGCPASCASNVSSTSGLDASRHSSLCSCSCRGSLYLRWQKLARIGRVCM